MKKLFYFIIFVFSLSNSLFATIFFPDNLNILGKRPVIVFDVDDVLVDCHLSFSQIKMFYQIFQESCDKWDLCKVVFWNYWNKKLIANQVSKFTDEEALDFIAQHHPVLYKKLKSGKSIKERYVEIKSTGVCFEESIDILCKLQKNGYKLAIATNHSTNTFKHLVNEGFLPSFDYYCYVCTSNSIPPVNKDKEDGFIKKPDMRYFQHLQEMIYKNCGSENIYIVFIDDNIKNIEAAQELGFIGIHFTSGNNLYRNLIALGFNL